MGNKLYVGNLSFQTTEETLSSQFANYGTVVSCRIITDRDTGRSKGFGFVEMSSGDEASEAISGMDNQEFDGRSLRVNEAKPQEKRNFNKNSW